MEKPIFMQKHVEEAMMHIGESLRIARKKRKWTAENLAAKICVSTKTISRMEKGDATVGMETFLSACLVFGMTDRLKEALDYDKDFVALSREKIGYAKKVKQKYNLKEL